MTSTQERQFQVYGYRWVILAVYALINAVMQIQWLTFAPIAREAREAYNATALQIDLLSMVFMLVFLAMCIPASYILDKYGIRVGVGIGAALAGVFGLMKGVFAESYAMVMVAQIGLSVAQPFILNSITKVAVHWFPINERATAVGIATLAQFLGMIVVNIATPLMITQTGGTYDLQGMLLTWGVVSAVSAALLIVFLREYPPTHAGIEGGEERLLTLDGLKHIFRHRDMILAMLMFFFGLGIFNAVATCIDQISEIKGFDIEQSGMIMGIMLIAGIIGAIIFPPISDKLRKRKPLLLLGVMLLTPGLAGMALADSYVFMLVAAGLVGMFLLGTAGPIGFQYVAEVSYPAPESLSQGIVLLAGQISGIIFIVVMNGMGMISSLFLFTGLAAVTIIIAALMKESPRILTASK
ncbi:MAG: MFS transporter [Spirochaetes bacterium]|nr:MAG: MFS transporter [Spirochaetota bacterium]